MNFTHPHFAEPHWLWLALLGPVALVLLQAYASRARRAQMARFAAESQIKELTRSHSPRRRVFKNTLLALAISAFGLALARPQWGEQETATTRLVEEDILFLLDCSRSMLATDVTPNRLQRAKLAIRAFTQRHGAGRLGLVAFAGQAFLQCPLTFDHTAFDESVVAVDENTIPIQGSDIGRALDEGFLAFEKREVKKVLVLVSDGEDTDNQAVKTAEKLAKQGAVVFTIGVGTQAGAELNLLNAQGQLEPVREPNGQVHRSRLDEAALRAIAQAAHGAYYPLGLLGEGLAKVRLAAGKASSDGTSTTAQKFGMDRFHFFVAAALVLLVAESLISTRRRAVFQ